MVLVWFSVVYVFVLPTLVSGSGCSIWSSCVLTGLSTLYKRPYLDLSKGKALTKIRR